MAKRIIQQNVMDDIRRKEYLVQTAVKPGMVADFGTGLKIIPGAATPQVNVHPLKIVDVDSTEAKGVAITFAADSLAPVIYPKAGDEVAVFLAAGENVAVGDKLSRAANGCLKKATDWVLLANNASGVAGATVADLKFPEQVVAIALEALDLSAGGAVATLINVEVQ